MGKLFVANFHFSVDDLKLKEFFEKAGTVLSAKVMKEADTGRSRGFGFVEMGTSEDAQRAIKDLDGTVWEGRVIKVNEYVADKQSHSRDRAPRGEGGGGGRGGEEGEGERRYTPLGYFRAQPLELTLRRRKKVDPFDEDKTLVIDYKNPRLLSRFTSERGRVLPRRMTGLSAARQRQISVAIKRAQHLALLPYNKS